MYEHSTSDDTIKLLVVYLIVLWSFYFYVFIYESVIWFFILYTVHLNPSTFLIILAGILLFIKVFIKV